jgi:large subunit ribosomal protein L17
VQHERITTTLAKAKEMRPLVEKLIHKAKQNNQQGHNFVFKTLFTRDTVKKVNKELVPRY